MTRMNCSELIKGLSTWKFPVHRNRQTDRPTDKGLRGQGVTKQVNCSVLVKGLSRWKFPVQRDRQTNKQTDGRTDGRTDRQTRAHVGRE